LSTTKTGTGRIVMAAPICSKEDKEVPYKEVVKVYEVTEGK
jgi:non-homologous end joining protein Ku